MARTTEKDAIKFVRMVHSEHSSYWKNKAVELRKYKNSYETKFWKDEHYDTTMIRIETADGFSYIEGFIASLFSRAPAVVIGKDTAASQGDAAMAQSAANRFLFTQREQLEIASRMALIYDFSALKLTPRQSDEMLDKVTIRAIPCWETIVDRDATGPDDQRFCGHVYYLNLVEAKSKFGGKKFNPVPKKDYFTDDVNSNNRNYSGVDRYQDFPDDYLYIQIVELYDLIHDEVYFWSPDYDNGESLLERSKIPVRTYDDQPLPNIVTLYFARIPSRPMEGISAMSRVYDQFYEKNILRTYWANSVRRDSRQYIYKEGSIDEEGLAKVTAGIDGAMIAVDTESLDGIIRPIPIEPISSNFDRYSNYIEQDINRGSILAPFSRGEATKATATEITALAQYSASEIGKMARDRDMAIESITNVYLRTIDLLTEEGETAVLDVDGSAKIITPDDLSGKFRISALDQGHQPLSDAIRKQNLVTLLPTLQGLGVSNDKILEELVRNYELPKNFLEKPAPAPQAVTAAPSAADVAQLEGGPVTNELPSQTLASSLTNIG
jgi:hypothetical protein